MAKVKAAPAPKPLAKAAAPKAKVAPVPAPKPKADPVPKAKVAPAPAPKAVPAAKPKADPVPKAKAAPKPKAAAKPKPAAKPVIPDNLELLKGVGPKLNTLLKSLGVTSFEQVANWTPAEVREIDSKLGTFAGRIGRDNWIDQAKLLVAGDVAGFEKKYGSLGSEINKG
jgi:predicted flap endonuclease-1-like 5' DNA nuclease